MIRSKQEDHIKKKTAIEKLRAGISSRMKSDNTYPFRFSIALKKKGKLVRIPAKTAIPTQNFHLKEDIFHASDHFKLKGEGVKLKAFPETSLLFDIFLYVNSESFKKTYLL
jgi:hypothetical protein